MSSRDSNCTPTRGSLHVVTPFFEDVHTSLSSGRRVFLKMECFQPAGSFKIRGIGLLCERSVAAGKRRLVCSSGGNAGFAVAYAARRLSASATIVELSTQLAAFFGNYLSADTWILIPANVMAWLVCTLAANAAHRRYTFQLAGRATEADHLVGALSSLAALGLSSLALMLLDEPGGLEGIVALVAVSAVVGAARFGALRWWWLGRRLRDRLAGARLPAEVMPV